MAYSKLYIDVETYSDVDILKCGLYKYIESSSFELLIFGYAYDNEDVQVIDIAQGESIPAKVLLDLVNPEVIKIAHNAIFEIMCIKKTYGIYAPEQWRDTMIMSYYNGLPGSLDDVCKILNLSEKKDCAGKLLIKYFSCPCSSTIVNGGRKRNHPAHDLAKWELYKKYNEQDVVAERCLCEKLTKYVNYDNLWNEYMLDQFINNRGVAIDLKLVKSAILFNSAKVDELIWEAQNITGLQNPNSAQQLKRWLSEIEKRDVPSIAKDADLNLSNPKAIRVMEIREQLAKTSISKYQTMLDSCCEDKKCHGLLQFYGASRTGRWAGRLVQVQNLPRNKIEPLDDIRSLVKEGCLFTLDNFYNNIPSILSQLIRTAFIPSKDKFIVADYSAIEARVIAWLAGEHWANEVFRTTGLIYENTAAKMFNIPIEDVTKDLRAKGKVATLALGYQGGTQALIAMGAEQAGIDSSELPIIVAKWRKANPNIVALWKSMESCAKEAIKEPTKCVKLPQNISISFIYSNGTLCLNLPSGRSLLYHKAHISSKDSIAYEGYISEDGSKAWGRVDTYGGKFTENCIQGIARDCLAYNMAKLENSGYQIVMHIHDEVVIDATNNQKIVDVIKIMSEPIPWAKGLYLTAAGFESSYYKKD